jgi:hypothetical protein
VAAIQTNADSISVSAGAAAVRTLTARGTIPGVVVDAVAGLNGPGVGCLSYNATTETLAWRAPGSATFGEAVDASADGALLLEDGEDADKFCRVTVYADYLPASHYSADVALADRFHNGMIAADVTAAQASAGATLYRNLTITCANAAGLTALAAWLDEAAALWIDDDGVTWEQPTTEETAVVVAASLAFEATATLGLKRVIPPSSSANPQVLDVVHLKFTVGETTHYHDLRGLYRVFNAAAHRFYRSQTGPPEPGDAPFATAAALPATPEVAWADGPWFVSVSAFNGVIDSGFLPLGPAGETYRRFDLAAGAMVGSPPAGAASWRLEPRAGGVVAVVGYYDETGANRAEQWAIAYTTDGEDPAADDPDLTEAMPASGMAVLEIDLPAQADATVVKVLVQTRRDDGTVETPVWVYSEDAAIRAAAANAVGPTAPLAGDRIGDVRREG